MKERKNSKKWVKARHSVILGIVRYPASLIIKLKTGIKIKKFKEQSKRQYLIVMNHQTSYDQFFVGMAFKRPVYYLATEDIFSLGFVSRLLQWALAPIPIKKQVTDVHAVMNCIRVAREGGTIALAPEGNRTYSGKTEYMNPAITKLIKKLGLPIAFFKIEGGYGLQPRWTDKLRKGHISAGVSKVLEPEEYKSMSDDELYEYIKRELYVNEACLDYTYKSKRSAEYLERAFYVCPECGLSRFESHGNTFKCLQCGLEAEYLPTKEFKGINREFKFKFANDWYEYQNDYIRHLDLEQYRDTELYRDEANISEVIVYKHKKLIEKNAAVFLFSNRIVISTKQGEHILPFDEISVISVLGRNKLNIYHKDKIYQLKGNKRFNALKYVNIYYHCKNVKEGLNNGEFLGL